MLYSGYFFLHSATGSLLSAYISTFSAPLSPVPASRLESQLALRGLVVLGFG